MLLRVSINGKGKILKINDDEIIWYFVLKKLTFLISFVFEKYFNWSGICHQSIIRLLTKKGLKEAIETNKKISLEIIFFS